MEKEKGGQRGEAVIRDGPAPSRAVSRRWAAAAAPNERTNARTHDPGTSSPNPAPIVAVSPLGTALRDRQHAPPGHWQKGKHRSAGSARVRAPRFGQRPGARSASASPHAA